MLLYKTWRDCTCIKSVGWTNTWRKHRWEKKKSSLNGTINKYGKCTHGYHLVCLKCSTQRLTRITCPLPAGNTVSYPRGMPCGFWATIYCHAAVQVPESSCGASAVPSTVVTPAGCAWHRARSQTGCCTYKITIVFLLSSCWRFSTLVYHNGPSWAMAEMEDLSGGVAQKGVVPPEGWHRRVFPQGWHRSRSFQRGGREGGSLQQGMSSETGPELSQHFDSWSPYLEHKGWSLAETKCLLLAAQKGHFMIWVVVLDDIFLCSLEQTNLGLNNVYVELVCYTLKSAWHSSHATSEFQPFLHQVTNHVMKPSVMQSIAVLRGVIDASSLTEDTTW